MVARVDADGHGVVVVGHDRLVLLIAAASAVAIHCAIVLALPHARGLRLPSSGFEIPPPAVDLDVVEPPAPPIPDLVPTSAPTPIHDDAPPRILLNTPPPPPPTPTPPAAATPPSGGGGNSNDAPIASDGPPGSADPVGAGPAGPPGPPGPPAPAAPPSSSSSSSLARLAPPTPPPASVATIDRSRAPSLRKRGEWACPWPAEADVDQIDMAIAVIVVTVDADGRATHVDVSDPGHGFGREARRCAMRESYIPALDKNGKPIASKTSPIRVRFSRE